MTRPLQFLLSLALVAPLASHAAPACPQPLRIGFIDSAVPPGLLGQGSTFADPPGWEVVAVRDALRKLGCPAELLRLPNRRLISWLAQDQVEFALLYGVTPERLQTFRFPLDAQGKPDTAWAPVFGHMALFGLPGTAPEPGWTGRSLPAGTRVGVIAGSVQESIARERGWAIELINQSDTGVSMLQAKRFEVMLTLRDTLTAEQRAALTEWTPAVAQLPYFVPASPKVERQHPEWTRQFWREVCQAVRRLETDVRPVDCGVTPPQLGR